MKKIILIVFSFLLFAVGCDSMMNTPTKKVEEFLNKYQIQNNEIVSQLNISLQNENNLNESQREKYKSIMLKQYKDLTYTIKEETIDGNNATVTVEIEVYDYNKSLNDSEEYYINNSNDFNGDISKFMDYKLDMLDNTTDRIKYTLNLTLTKNDKTWELNNITESDRLKIHGLYNT